MPTDAARPPLFGVPPLDSLLGRPTKGGTVLARNDPRIDARPLLLQAAGHALSSGRPVLFAVLSRAPSRVRQALHALGFTDHDDLAFFDAHSGTFDMGESSQYRLHDPSDTDAFLALLAQAAQDHPDALLVLDSLDRLAPDAATLQAILDPYLDIAHQFRTSITALTRWPPDATDAADRFDACIDLDGIGDILARHRAFRIHHSKWKRSTDDRHHLYEVEQPGGVCIHIPKIAIIGPGDAGKTSFVQSVSLSAQSADRLGTTVALDRGRYTGGGIVAELFGTPGQPRFDPLLDPLLDQAVGAVLLVHTTKKADLKRAHEVLDRVRKRGIHIVVAATHQDDDGPTPEAIRKAFPEIADLPILPCIATQKDSATHVLETLIASIQGGAAA